MADIQIKRCVQLDRPIAPESLSGALYTTEDGAHQFVISAMRGDTPVALAGTVSGKLHRCYDDVTVPLTGTLSEGKAYVTLNNSCYLYNGRVEISIFVTESGATTCVYAAVGRVIKTDGATTVDPSGEITIDVNTLLTAIETATASIPADYSDLLDTIADTFSTDTNYAAGAYAWYSGTLYCFPNGHTAGSWTGTDAVAVVLSDQITDLKSRVSILEPSATSSDVGKALKVKTVSGGAVTEWELGEAAAIDATLTQAGEAADAKATGDAISALSSRIGDLDELETTDKSDLVSAINEVASGATIAGEIDQITEKLTLKPAGHNLCDPDAMAVGTVTKAGVITSGATSYRYTGKIAVSEGQVIRFYQYNGTTLAGDMPIFITAYDSTDTAVEAKGSGNVFNYTVPAGIVGLIITFVVRDGYMVTADYQATQFESYQPPYYVATDDFIEEALQSEIDDTLTETGKPADAKATGDAIAELSSRVNEEIAEALSKNTGGAPVSKFGNWETITRSETAAIIPINNSVLTSPISNAIKAKILSISGNADGSVPEGFVARTKNLLNPAFSCACASNQAANYQVPTSTPSTAMANDNDDGTFTLVFPLGYATGIMLSELLTVGETYEVYYEATSSTGFYSTLYTLDSGYKVVRKLAYIPAGQKKMYRIKLDTNEIHIGVQFGSSSNSEVRTITIKYPEVRISETKNPNTDLVQENTVSNEYWYQPYHVEKITFDTDAIQALFPGFGQANGNAVNMFYPAEKAAFQYGYYSGESWVSDAKKIDLSNVMGDFQIPVMPNGTLEMLYDGESVPAWTAEYTLAVSEPYIGYTWTGLGDSLTAGADKNGVWGFYRQDVKETLGLYKYNDCGIGTSALSGVGTYKAFWTDERVESLPLDSDVITIMGGTNDTAQLDAETNPGATRAGFGDATMSNEDCRTFIGSYNVLISKIMYKFMRSAGYYQDVDYTDLTQVTTPKPWFRLVLVAPPPVLTSASTIEAMTKIAECVHKVGEMWGLPVVDAHANIGVNDMNKDSFFTVDYVHPNEEAHKRIAALIVAKAREID